MSKPIPPTVGRVVHYTPRKDLSEGNGFAYYKGSPCAAIIAHVWTDRCVNLTVLDHDGQQHAITSVDLVQPGEGAPPNGGYCTWMPYQVGQAAKTERLQQQLDAQAKTTALTPSLAEDDEDDPAIADAQAGIPAAAASDGDGAGFPSGLTTTE